MRLLVYFLLLLHSATVSKAEGGIHCQSMLHGSYVLRISRPLKLLPVSFSIGMRRYCTAEEILELPRKLIANSNPVRPSPPDFITQRSCLCFFDSFMLDSPLPTFMLSCGSPQSVFSSLPGRRPASEPATGLFITYGLQR